MEKSLNRPPDLGPDFEIVDLKTKFRDRDRLLKIAKEKDYEHISEMFYCEYFTYKKSTTEISRETNVPRSSIVRWMNKWGWDLRHPGNRENKTIDPELRRRILKLSIKFPNHIIRDILGIDIKIVNQEVKRKKSIFQQKKLKRFKQEQARKGKPKKRF